MIDPFPDGHPADAYAWQAFVSRRLRRRLTHAPALSTPESEPIEAVLLLSDIEGFTKHVERAAAQGAAGLERLSAQLNHYVERLSNVVLEQGGDVLYVAGDAFLCLFEPNRAESLRDVALRAARAAWRMQALLVAPLPAAAGADAVTIDALRTRIGLAGGPVSTGFVGGHGGRWDLVLGGPTLAAVIEAERLAPVTRVMLAPALAALTQTVLSLEPCEEGFALLRRPPAMAPAVAPALPATDEPDGGDPAALRPWVPAIVLQRVLLSGGAWLSEFRSVSVVMVNLPVLDAGDPQSLARLHRGVLLFQQTIARFEGTVKVDVDDKGVLMLGVFGLPPLAHEDDAARAVRAALAQHKALADAELSADLAVCTGRGFISMVGGQRRREYMLRGEVINRAARLMVQAGGEVLCDAATVQAGRAAACFVAAGERALRAGAPTVPVWRAVEGAAVPPAGGGLVGREAERALIEGALQRLAGHAHEPALLLVEAEAGMGKSCLLAHGLERAEAIGLRSWYAAAASIERATPYHAWRALFQRLLGVSASAAPAALWAQLGARAAALPAPEQRLLPLLADVLGMPLPADDLTASLVGEVRADNTRALLLALLRQALATQPTLLVLEDRHWLDSASAALLLALAQAALAERWPLGLLVSGRPLHAGEAQRSATDLALLCEQAAPAHRLQLQVLDEPEMRALLQQRLRSATVPDALVSFVTARVGGHPFFCEEFVHMLLGSGALRFGPRQEVQIAPLQELERLDLPTTVEAAIVARIDRLDESEQLCLKIGAVIGRHFHAATVADAHPVQAEREHVTARLHAICQTELALPDADERQAQADPGAAGAASSPSFRFKHQITRDVTYDLMPQATRAPLHAGVARSLEAAAGADLSPLHPVLAWHWAQAGDTERALPHLEAAGQDALRAGNFREALGFFSQTLQLTASEGADRTAEHRLRRARWDKGLGTAHYFLGEMDASQRCLERALALLDRPIPATPNAANRALLTELARQAWRALQPRCGHRPAEALHKAALDEAVDICRMLGQIYYLDGSDMGRVSYVTMRGVNVGETAGPSAALARVLANAGSMMSWLGLDRIADAYTRRAVEMAGTGGKRAAEAYVWNIAAITQAQRGRWAGALAANDRALGCVLEVGDHNLEAEVWVVRGTIHQCTGNYAALAQVWPMQRALALKRHNPQVLCWSYLDECLAALGADDLDAAARTLDQALAIETAPNDGSSSGDKAHARALVRLRQGRHAEAAVAVHEVVQLVTRQPPSGYHWVEFLACSVEVAIALTAAEPAAAWAMTLRCDLARGLKALRRLSGRFRNVLPRSRLLLGLALVQRGPRSATPARAALEQALALGRAHCMPYEVARALLALHETGTVPTGTLAEARSIFEQLGAHAWLRRLERAQGLRRDTPAPMG